MYQHIHNKIHELETELATALNNHPTDKAKRNLERAHDILVHQVAEHVRGAEKR